VAFAHLSSGLAYSLSHEVMAPDVRSVGSKRRCDITVWSATAFDGALARATGLAS
jgi:hypothetical protein